MRRGIRRVVLTLGFVCVAAGAALAQSTASMSETKAFEVLAVDGNQLVVRLPEGTRELTVPNDFRFTINGQQMSVQQLKVGMKGTATITTTTTVTPVTVTEIKSGTVMQSGGSSIIVRTPEGVKMFTQGDVDKRGVKIMRGGKPAQVSDFRQGDQLTATIITSLPPRVMTEKEVQATLATATSGSGAKPAAAASSTSSASSSSRSGGAAPASGSAQNSQAGAGGASTLPKTASSWPLLAFASILSLAIGMALMVTRRFVF